MLWLGWWEASSPLGVLIEVKKPKVSLDGKDTGAPVGAWKRAIWRWGLSKFPHWNGELRSYLQVCKHILASAWGNFWQEIFWVFWLLFLLNSAGFQWLKYLSLLIWIYIWRSFWVFGQPFCFLVFRYLLKKQVWHQLAAEIELSHTLSGFLTSPPRLPIAGSNMNFLGCHGLIPHRILVWKVPQKIQTYGVIRTNSYTFEMRSIQT